ncbi:Septin-domain-containing protein [Phakopsora pachyrhizi]|uniref:Septin-domain-containing protein n=1 Tax=Phakopsora pachyrhizi TaxID=170000 RepID=A0AAV0AGK2_PHAPC|nr:Septin-domain-containing protein [Phakopsora pachyrhizi]
MPRLVEALLEFPTILLIVVGQIGLGKSTLINTIFASHLIDSKGRLDTNEIICQKTEIQVAGHVVVENNVKLRLNIVDTPGYGDMVNNDGCWEPIIKIHCCLYFIAPTSHGLRPINIIVMKKLSEVVNVVPVIAKSDGLTLEEREAFKVRIRTRPSYSDQRADLSSY